MYYKSLKKGMIKMKKRILFKRICLITTALALVMGNAACKKEVADSDTLKIVWYCTSSGKDPDHDKVLEVFNQKLKEKYGMELDFYPIVKGEYAAKMRVMNAAREEYDLCYVNGLSAFYSNIENGVYYDITELLPKYAPKTYKSMDEEIWKAASKDGRIYAVPNWQSMARSDCLMVREEWLDKTGYSMDDLNTYEDLEKYMEKAISINPNANKISSAFKARYWGFVDVYNESSPGMIRLSEFDSKEAPKIVNQYETEEFKEYIKYARRMVEKGLFYGTYSPDNSGAGNRGEVPYSFQSTYKPGLEGELEANYGYPLEVKQFSPATITPSNVMATATAVSATSRNPEKAVEFIEIINTDKELYNLLCWGLEGEHYKKISDNVIEPVDLNKYGYYNWAIGSVKNSFVLSSQDENTWEETQKFNDDALVSPLMGMVVDTSGLLTEITDCSTVLNEKLPLLRQGLVDPDTGIKELIDALKVAGSDKIIAELQRQVDEWWATK